MTTNNMPLVHLSGTPRERGRAHGETLRELIHGAVQRWKATLAAQTGREPNEYLSRFLSETNFPAAIQKWTPDLWEEIHGIAEGAGLEFETILTYQFMDEEWWYKRFLSRVHSPAPAEHCSGVAVFDPSGEIPTLMAQNMDLNSYYDGSQALLHIQYPDTDVESYVFTAAGLIALNGLNNHQIGVCVNTLIHLDHAIDGLPVAFVIRGVLAKSSFEEAVLFLQSIKHASGQNYIIGGPTKAVDYECSANKVVRYEPQPGKNYLYHTNHALMNSDSGMYEDWIAKVSTEEKEFFQKNRANSKQRFTHLETNINSDTRTLTVDDIRRLLSETENASICVTRNTPGWLTLGCTIMDLSSSPRLFIAPGPPDETPFQTYQF